MKLSVFRRYIPQSTQVKRKRRKISLDEKLYVINRLEAGESVGYVARLLDLGESTVRAIRNNASKIIESAKCVRPRRTSVTPYTSSNIMEYMEQKLVAWVNTENKRDGLLTSWIIMEKAEELYHELKFKSNDRDIKPFVASYSWAHQFKRNANLHDIEWTEDDEEENDFLEDLYVHSDSPCDPLNNMEREMAFVSVGETEKFIMKEEETLNSDDTEMEDCQLTRKKRIKLEEEHDSLKFNNSAIKPEINIKVEPLELDNDDYYEKKFPAHEISTKAEPFILKQEKEIKSEKFPSNSSLEENTNLSKQNLKNVKSEKKKRDTSLLNKNEMVFPEVKTESGIKNEPKSSFKRISGRLFKCSECSYETHKKNCLRKHLLCHSNHKQFQCTDCAYRSTRKHNLTQHLLTHSVAKLLKCSVCDYETNQKADLKVHSLNHSASKRFQCSECDYETNRKGDIKSHKEIHTSSEVFRCPECDFTTKLKCYLKRHLLTHARVMQCPQCSYKTNRSNCLASHMKIHSKAEVFKCPDCIYTTNRKANLRSHLVTHVKLKLFKCSKCDYESKRKCLLTKHEAKHK